VANCRAERKILLAFLEEIKTMSNVENHPNVLGFVGAYTEQMALGKSHALYKQ